MRPGCIEQDFERNSISALLSLATRTLAAKKMWLGHFYLQRKPQKQLSHLFSPKAIFCLREGTFQHDSGVSDVMMAKPRPRALLCLKLGYFRVWNFETLALGFLFLA